MRCLYEKIAHHKGFSQMHKIGNNTVIANFVFLYNCSFFFIYTNLC